MAQEYALLNGKLVPKESLPPRESVVVEALDVKPERAVLKVKLGTSPDDFKAD